MPYSREFFALQLAFAEALTEKFALPLADVVENYTTFTKGLGGGEEWQAYQHGLQACSQPEERVEWTYQWYLPRSGSDPTAQDTHFHGHVLFGCFYYEVRENGRIIRPHLIKNNRSGQDGVLSYEQMPTRQQELRALFAHVRAHVPEAEIVRGNSWMYNLESYRRLFPPEYTASLPKSDQGEFQFLSRWGQFFDRHWQVKESLASVLFDRLKALERIEDLHRCFPYPILQPQSPIQPFYAFYGSSEDRLRGTGQTTL